MCLFSISLRDKSLLFQKLQYAYLLIQVLLDSHSHTLYANWRTQIITDFLD